MRNHLIDNLKIILAMGTAFVIVKIFSQTIFLFNTPKFNYFFLAKIFQKSKSPSSSPLSAMTLVRKGVYAKEDKELKTVYIRITKDAQWEEKIFTNNGQRIRILYPKGTF